MRMAEVTVGGEEEPDVLFPTGGRIESDVGVTNGPAGPVEPGMISGPLSAEMGEATGLPWSAEGAGAMAWVTIEAPFAAGRNPSGAAMSRKVIQKSHPGRTPRRDHGKVRIDRPTALDAAVPPASGIRDLRCAGGFINLYDR